jgi:hypothetical protein
LKLIGGKAREYLNSLLIHVNTAPANHQDKYGLAERHWQTIVNMARNWLASAELPSTFWFYAVQHAAEVCNYFPYRLEDGSYSTPFEIAHKTKPDLRVLFKLFGLAAVHRERIGASTLNKFEAQSVPMIAIGCCPNSNGIQFYNPSNSTFVSSIDYRFQYHVTSGAKFGYNYQPGTFIYRLDESTSLFAPKFSLDSDALVHTHSPPHQAKVIGIPSYDRPDIYTVLFPDGSIAEYSDNNNILEAVSPKLVYLPLVSFLLGFRGVQMRLYFSLLCQNLVMENYSWILIIIGSSVQGIQLIFHRVLNYLIYLLLFKHYWILDKYFVVMQNSIVSTMLGLKFNFRIACSVMFLLMV